MSFSDEVDTALQGMRVVLGTGDPPDPADPKPLSAAPAWPNWTGTVSSAAHDASNGLDRSRTQIQFDQIAAVSLIKHAGAVATSARSRMDGVQAGWQQDKASFASIAETPLGQISLLHAGQKRLTEARDVIADAMTEFNATAQKLETVSSDLPLLARVVPPPQSVDDMLLPPSALGAPIPGERLAEEGAEPGEGPFNPWPTDADIAVGAGGLVAGGTADGIRQTTLRALEASPGTGPGRVDAGLLRWFEDPTINGFSIKGFNRVGGLVAVATAVPGVMSDIGEGNSVAEAVTRESVGTVAAISLGAVAGDAAAGALAGSVVPGVGTAVGLVVGAGVGAVAAFGGSKLVDWLWE